MEIHGCSLQSHAVKRLRAYAAAGVGNFAAGFDVLGASLAPVGGSLWGDTVEIEAADSPRFTVATPVPASSSPQRLRQPPQPLLHIVGEHREAEPEVPGKFEEPPGHDRGL